MSFTEYVLGFVFNPTGEIVVLQKKQKPEWQRNRWNGIGGHVESGEPPSMAMARECMEETSLEIDDWQKVCELSGPSYRLHVFRATTSIYNEFEVPTGAEELACFEVCHIPYTVIPNVRWLIPMALSFSLGEAATSFVITEQHCQCAKQP